MTSPDLLSQFPTGWSQELAEPEVSCEHVRGERSVSKLGYLSVEFKPLMPVGLRIEFWFSLD